MSKYISVASHYMIYEVPDETFEVLPTGMKTSPSYLVLETMVLNGQAKRIGSVGMAEVGLDGPDIIEDDEEPPEGMGPWLEEEDED